MRKAIVLLAVVLVVGSIPSTMARHRSVGVEDQAVSQEDEPTVPNDAQLGQDTGDADTPHEVGTTHPADCIDVRGELSPDGVQRATSADEYCGELVYNEEVPTLTVSSPPDQEILSSKIGTFDVVRTDLVGIPGGLTLCTPFCDGFLLPGGNDRHQLFYDTVSETGLTHDSEETRENQRQNRRNYVSAQLAYPNAGMTIQRETGLWEMNGWVNPNAETTYVGFLYDADGNAIGPDKLDGIVDARIQAGTLPSSATPKVCGFTEDRTIGTTKTDSLCEYELKYFEPEEDPEASFTEYGDRCTSPTYVCNNVGGPAWRASPPPFYGSSVHPESGAAEDVTVPGLGVPEDARIYPVEEDGVNWGDGDSFVTWHWVVAPSPQDCPAQEPGVALSNPNGDPYLAHDLDSYVPITRISQVDTPSEGSVETYGEQIAAGPIETLNGLGLPGVVQDVQDTASAQADEAVGQVTATQNETIGHVAKDHRREPNADPARNPLEDTSRSHVEFSQTPLDACQRATTGETEETADPWVDLIDSQVTYTEDEFVDGVPSNVTLYGNDEGNQDPSNNPGPTRMSTSGHVGLFTDNDNDGNYDAIDDPYQPSGINSAGAYPMLWDVKVDRSGDTATITGSGSCEFTGTQTVKLSLEAARLGYGPNTGVFQLVYLQEPTVVDANVLAVQDRLVYPGGNNIYLLASQSVRELTDLAWDDAKTFAIEKQLDRAVNDLQAWVVANTGATTEPQVIRPGDAFGFTSDFEHQCTAGVETGEFESKVSFTHDCQAVPCEGDTIVSRYVFEVTTSDGTLDGAASKLIPAFSDINDRTATFDGFATGINAWTDVDPLDGDPERNDASTPPPQ